MENKYKLRCSLVGHEKDVRSVHPSYVPEGGILSSSRDMTSRVWASNEHDSSFTEGLCMGGHKGFVSCVITMPPDEKYQTGLIFTGGQDKCIHAYTLSSPEPVFKLEGHADTVCSLACGKFGTLLSGSWDTTAKVWLNQKNLMTLQGHKAAVWCVAVMPEQGFMLTGSADKTIKLWKAGKCERTLSGHEDCVRGLTVLSATDFLSCANDASVRRWSINGGCIATYYGHENYIYSIAVLPNGEDFVTSGEDRTVRVWRNGACEQTIIHPTQSVWGVCVLPNGDIVSAASDGLVRVFTCSLERMAPEEEQKAFEEQLAASSIPAEIGDVKTDQLPGPEVLLNPGKHDGQTIMVRDSHAVTAHQWSAGDGRWLKIGDVVGGESSGKKQYQGKEYDYVFDVDIQEDKPPLKLPFNKTEDPWTAAHNFLARNEISQMYLDQVAKFIMQQTKGVTLGQAPAIPNVDPFTGVGSSVPLSAASVNTPSSNEQYFPKTSYYVFDAAKPASILEKLKKFNADVDATHQLQDDMLDSLTSLMNGSGQSATAAQLDALWKLLQWPPDMVFPGLDALRLAIRQESVNRHFYTSQFEALPDLLLKYLSPESKTTNQMLALRILTNSFCHDFGRGVLKEYQDQVISAVLTCVPAPNKQVAVALSSLLLNYAVLIHQNKDVEALSNCLTAVANVLQTEKDPEANFRLLVAVGTLIAGDDIGKTLALSLGLQDCAKKLKSISDPVKVGNCARDLENMIN